MQVLIFYKPLKRLTIGINVSDLRSTFYEENKGKVLLQNLDFIEHSIPQLKWHSKLQH